MFGDFVGKLGLHAYVCACVRSCAPVYLCRLQHVQPVCPLLPRSSEQPHILPSFVIQKLDRGEILDRAMDTDALPTLDQEDNNDIVMEAITMKKRRARKVTKHQKRKRRKRDLMERRITRRHEKIRTKKVKRIG